jgi:tetratricopeptide (TPR) repeat protein
MTANPDAFLRSLEGRFMLANPRRYPVDATAAMFDQALQRDPGFLEARVSRAWCLLREVESSTDLQRERLTTAATLLSDGSEMTASSPSVLSAHGLLQQLQGQYEKAAEFLNTGLRTFPGDAEIRRRLATIMMMRGDTESAMRHARQAVSFDPLNAESYAVLAAIHKFDGDNVPALQAYQHAAPLSTSGEEFTVRYLPELFVSVQKHDSAEAILANAVGKSREDYVLYYRLGRVYQAAGKSIDRWEEVLRRSQTVIQRRLSSVPCDGIARSYLALVLTRLGRKKEAETEIQRALRDRRDHPVVLYNAARAYAMQREFPPALEYLDKAIGLKYDPDLIFDMDFFNLRGEADFHSVVTR